MKYLVLASFLLLSYQSWALPWNKSVLTHYGKTKTYKELFCKASEKNPTCLHYKKTLGNAIAKKPLRISMTEEDTLWVHTDVAQIKIVKETPTKFFVNGRKMDLLEISSRRQLREALRGTLPKRSTSRLSLFINSAWAQSSSAFLEVVKPGAEDLEVIASIDHLIVASRSVDSCAEVSKFLEACTQNMQMPGLALGQAEIAWKQGDIATKKAQMKVIDEYLKGLNILVGQMEKNRTSAFIQKGGVNSCIKTQGKENSASFMKECRISLEQTREALKAIQDKMYNQMVEYEIVEERISTLERDMDMEEGPMDYELEEMNYAPVKTKTGGKSKSSSGTQ